MDEKLLELRSIFELAVCDEFFGNTRKSVQISAICPDDQIIVDFYTKPYGKDAKLRRYRKNIQIGYFYKYDNCIIYHHVYRKSKILPKIRLYLKEALIDFAYLGNFLVFEPEDRKDRLQKNDPLVIINNTGVIVRLEYIKISDTFVPSKRSTRLFAYHNKCVYAERHANGKHLNSNIIKELYYNGKLNLKFDMMPMLFMSKYYHTTIDDIEQYYTEKMVKVLTN